MAYCTISDLQDSHGEENISGWSRMDADIAERAIENASAEIDGYLLSGGYTVPLDMVSQTIQKYCIDIACANLIISAGVLSNDPGGNAVIEQAKVARRYLEKVADGKFKIPGYAKNGDGDKAVSLPALGTEQARSMEKMDLRGY
jgi:phage gp36-like protein